VWGERRDLRIEIDMDIHYNSKAIERRVKQHIIAHEHRFFAIVQPGFEDTAARELKEIDACKTADRIEGGIEFQSRLEGCYRANICSRTITRVLMRVGEFKADRFDILNKKMGAIPWELYISPQTPVSFSVKSGKSRLYHRGRIEDEAADAIGKRLEQHGIRVSFPENADHGEAQKIFIRLEENKCQISLDTTGDLLYKRGEKTYITQAPIRETLASLILKEAGLKDYDMLLDPMCGSGTFSIEASGIFNNTFPGMDRDFIFMKWPAFREKAYNHLKKKLSDRCDTVHGKKIIASDIDSHSVFTAEKNMESASLKNNITVNQTDFFNHIIEVPHDKKCLIVLNPPYGTRLDRDSTEKIYRSIGLTIKRHYSSCGYAIITPGLEYEKILSLPYDRKILFMNGGIRVAAIIRDARVTSRSSVLSVPL